MSEKKVHFYKVLYLGSKLSEKDVFLEQQKLIIRQKEGVDTNFNLRISMVVRDFLSTSYFIFQPGKNLKPISSSVHICMYGKIGVNCKSCQQNYHLQLIRF